MKQFESMFRTKEKHIQFPGELSELRQEIIGCKAMYSEHNWKKWQHRKSFILLCNYFLIQDNHIFTPTNMKGAPYL